MADERAARTAGKTLCRSCGAGFRAFLGGEAVIACPRDPCQAWAARYREALRLGSDLPPEYGMAPVVGVVAVLSHARKREGRRVARRIEAEANANQQKQIAREKASRARGEVEISAERYL